MQNRMDIFEFLATLPTFYTLNPKGKTFKSIHYDGVLYGARSNETLFGTRGSVLTNAIRRGQLDLIKFFMKLTGDRKIDFNHGHLYDQDHEGPYLPIHPIYPGPMVRDIDDYNWPFFHIACIAGNVEAVELFLEKANELGIDLNAEGVERMTPFQISVHKGRKQIVQVLLRDLRIDVNSNFNGDSPLMLSLSNKTDESLEIFETLLQSPRISLDTVHAEGETIFHKLSKLKVPEHTESFFKEALRHKTFNFNQKNDSGKSAIHYAFDYSNNWYV